MEDYQINIDLDSVIQFREEFRELADNLEVSRLQVAMDITVLNETWKDSEFQKFYTRYKDDNEFLVRLIENINELNDGFLYRMQDKLEIYLGIK
jgi:hypothetical protein